MDSRWRAKAPCLLVVLGAAILAPAQSSKLVNIDTNWVPRMNSWSLRGDVRSFGSHEGTTYGSLEIDGGLGNGLGLTLRGTASRTLNFNGPGFTIRHGGSDVEAMLKYSVPLTGLMLGAGISVPNTPAQRSAFATAEAVYKVPATTGFDLLVGGKGVFRNNSSIMGAFAGVDAKLSLGFDLIADVTVPFTGRNTYSTSSGALERSAVFGAAVRFTPPTPRVGFSVDAGITNGLGATTGMSFTPALGNQVGLYLAASVRY